MKIETDKTDVSKKDEDFFKKFTAICISNYYSLETLVRIVLIDTYHHLGAN